MENQAMLAALSGYGDEYFAPVVRECHSVLDAAGIAGAVGVVCNDAGCCSQLGHRLRDALAQLRAANERAERAEKQRDEAVRVGRHLCKRLGDEFGITITEEWSRAVIDGEHDKPLPSRLHASSKSLMAQKV